MPAILGSYSPFLTVPQVRDNDATAPNLWEHIVLSKNRNVYRVTTGIEFPKRRQELYVKEEGEDDWIYTTGNASPKLYERVVSSLEKGDYSLIE